MGVTSETDAWRASCGRTNETCHVPNDKSWNKWSGWSLANDTYSWTQGSMQTQQFATIKPQIATNKLIFVVGVVRWSLKWETYKSELWFGIVKNLSVDFLLRTTIINWCIRDLSPGDENCAVALTVSRDTVIREKEDESVLWKKSQEEREEWTAVIQVAGATKTLNKIESIVMMTRSEVTNSK